MMAVLSCHPIAPLLPLNEALQTMLMIFFGTNDLFYDGLAVDVTLVRLSARCLPECRDRRRSSEVLAADETAAVNLSFSTR